MFEKFISPKTSSPQQQQQGYGNPARGLGRGRHFQTPTNLAALRKYLTFCPWTGQPRSRLDWLLERVEAQ